MARCRGHFSVQGQLCVTDISFSSGNSVFSYLLTIFCVIDSGAGIVYNSIITDKGEITIYDSVISMEAEEIRIEDDFSPIFAVDDNSSVALARYDNGEVAAAISGKSIWIGLPLLTKKLMVSIMKLSGVHSYCQSANAVIAGAGIVAINCPSGGEHTVTLKNGKEIYLKLENPETAVFDADSGERLL